LKYIQDEVNSNLILQVFSENFFRRCAMFPYLEIEKKGKSWVVEIGIGEELYNTKYPFFFPTSFLIYQSKHDLQMKILLIQSFCILNLEKNIPIKDFLL